MAWLGIDIGKADFHTYLIEGDRRSKKSFPNTPAGFTQLSNWLKNRKVSEVSACMEATGAYWQALALYLFEAGHRISVVNPFRIKAFAQSKLSRTKTDPLDAALIAEFCQTQQPEPWKPPAAEIRLLQALTRHLENLKSTRSQQKTRLKTPELPELVRASIAELITTLDGQIKEIEAAISDHINRHPGLKTDQDLLTSVPGIGDITAFQILAEIPELKSFRTRQAVGAYAGLSPRVRQSGTSLHSRGRICKTGNARLRKALYMAALAARRFNPILKRFALRLAAAGKPNMVIVAAVMRKLLVLAYGVIKSGQPFSASHAELSLAP